MDDHGLKLEFEVRSEDLASLMRHTQRRSPLVTEQCDRGRWFGASLLALAGLVGTWATFKPAWVVLGLILAGVFFALYPRWFWSTLDQRISRLCGQPSVVRLLGPRQLTLADGRLIAEAPLISSRLDLRAIHRLIARPRRLFVLLSDHDGLVVPRDTVREGDFDAFREALIAAVGAVAGSPAEPGDER